MPVICPEFLPRLSPGGKAPETRDHVRGGTPPTVAMAVEYCPLMYPPGRVEGEVMESMGAGVMEIWNCCVTVRGVVAVSVTVTVKSTGPG
jgi:hypothetical protein